MKYPLAAAVLLAGTLVSAPIVAQQAGGQHGTHGSMAGSSMNPAMQEMHKSHEQMNQRMQQAMSNASNKEADAAFVEMMIPHHQGAVDMAKAALPHIKDPELRRMAEKTMQENQKEIEEMRSWQSKRR